MESFNVKKFREVFGFKPAKAFDVMKHFSSKHMELMLKSPTGSIVRAEYGELDHEGEKAFYMLAVLWTLVDGEALAHIEEITLFDSREQMEEWMKKPILGVN